MGRKKYRLINNPFRFFHLKFPLERSIHIRDQIQRNHGKASYRRVSAFKNIQESLTMYFLRRYVQIEIHQLRTHSQRQEFQALIGNINSIWTFHLHLFPLYIILLLRFS